MTYELPPIGRFRSISWIDKTGSTNADLVTLVKSGGREPKVLLADEQTAGRGRRDRTWEMPAGGGLLMSLFVPWTDVSTNHLIPTALGVAAVEAISRIDRVVSLKWPNDLLAADGRKLAGMLSEGVTSGTEALGVVVGMGCNVSWPTGASDAASLDEIGGPGVERRELAVGLIGEFDHQLDELADLGPDVLQERYRERCGTLGREVRVETATDLIEGVAVDVDSAGRLVLEIDGALQAIDVGDVVHLRPQT